MSKGQSINAEDEMMSNVLANSDTLTYSKSGTFVDEDIDTQLLPTWHIPTRASASSGLIKPIAIPATTNSIGSPFLRAYPTSLEDFNISRELFLKFLDDLNRVAVKNPPLIVLTLAGNALSFVPLPMAQITSAVVTTVAALSTLAISKGRTEIELRKANRTIFNPRGLKVEVAKMDALAKIAGIPVLNDQGKIDKDTTLLQPLDDTEDSKDISSQQRRLQTLEPYIAELDLEPLPSIEAHKNPLSRLSVAASESQRKREEKKLLKKRNKAQEKYTDKSEVINEEYDKDMSELLLREERVRAENDDDGHKSERALDRIEKDKQKIEQSREKQHAKIERNRKKNDKEEKGMRKILWIIIRGLDADSGEGANPDVPDDG